MSKKKSLKRDLIEWGIFIALISTLYLTGLHTPVLGALQGLVLKTGLIQPKVEKTDHGNADYNFQLENIEGEIVSFEKFRGKTIFINLWATWCPPCVAEMPDINDLYHEVDNENVVFVMISLDKSFEKAKSYVKKKEYKFPVYTLKSSLPQVYESNAIPTTYVISPNGKIVMTKQGMAKYNTTKFKNFFDELSTQK